MREKNSYETELSKFVRQEVVVIDSNGDKHSGVCIAIASNHLNVILRTSTEKIIIKNICSISRKRDLSWQR